MIRTLSNVDVLFGGLGPLPIRAGTDMACARLEGPYVLGVAVLGVEEKYADFVAVGRWAFED